MSINQDVFIYKGILMENSDYKTPLINSVSEDK